MALKFVSILLFSVFLFTTYVSVMGSPEEILIMFELDRAVHILDSARTELKPANSKEDTRRSFGNENPDVMRAGKRNLAIVIRNKRGKTMLFSLLDYVRKDSSKIGEETPVITTSVPGQKVKGSLWDTMAYNGK